eukprot:757379-Hanusia_phi.AAC.10
MKGKKRVFVSVELSHSDTDAVARAIETLQCQQPWAQLKDRMRWVNPRNSHLTLRFFGDMEDEEIEALRSGLDEELSSLKDLEPFPLAVSLEVGGDELSAGQATSLGSFQRKGLPSVLWLGLSKETVEKLQVLEKSVGRAAHAENDERFSPHITLARFSFKGKGEPQPTTLTLLLAGTEQDSRMFLKKLRAQKGGEEEQKDFWKLICGRNGAVLDFNKVGRTMETMEM